MKEQITLTKVKEEMEKLKESLRNADEYSDASYLVEQTEKKLLNQDKKWYFCIGCRKIHYDDDFSEEDGDLEIDKESFFESLNLLKKGK